MIVEHGVDDGGHVALRRSVVLAEHERFCGHANTLRVGGCRRPWGGGRGVGLLPIEELREDLGLAMVTEGKNTLSCSYSSVTSLPRKILAMKVPPVAPERTLH